MSKKSKKQLVADKVVILNQQPKKKKRRSKRKQRRISNSSTTNFYTWAGFDALNVIEGTSHLLENYFGDPACMYRGLAAGSQPTALAPFQNFIDFSVAAGGFANFAIAPSILNTGQFVVGTNSTTLDVTGTPGMSPWRSGVGITAITQGGPFFLSNPSNNNWRVVGFELRLWPTSAQLNQGGLSVFAHIPEIYSNSQTTSANYTGPASSAELQNQYIRRNFEGTDCVVYHWMPNDDELYLQEYANPNLEDFSGVYFTVINPTSGIQSYRAEYSIRIEYTPNINYVSVVEKKFADIHPSSQYYLNRLGYLHWDPMILGTLKEYTAIREGFKPLSGRTSVTKAFFASNLESKGIPTGSQLSTVMEEGHDFVSILNHNGRGASAANYTSRGKPVNMTYMMPSLNTHNFNSIVASRDIDVD
jgi:hypothetical protein